jgi:hypothetical protein
MRAILVVVANIFGEQAFQAAFVNCDDVILVSLLCIPRFCGAFELTSPAVFTVATV